MNSQTQLLVKMNYAESVCKVLMRHTSTIDAFATLDWLKDKTAEIIKDILFMGGVNALSWARVAERCCDNIRTLKDDDWSDQPLATVNFPEEIIYNLAVLTRMLEDTSVSKVAKGYDMDSMITAAYKLEELLGLKGRNKDYREDEIRESAFIFLDQLYKKMGEI